MLRGSFRVFWLPDCGVAIRPKIRIATTLCRPTNSERIIQRPLGFALSQSGFLDGLRRRNLANKRALQCKSYSCNSGAFRPTESHVQPDRERAAARVETPMHRKSCKKDFQCSLSIMFCCLCHLFSTTVLSPLALACEYRALGPNHLDQYVIRPWPLVSAIAYTIACIAYAIAYAIACLYFTLRICNSASLFVRPVRAFLQERAISR